MSSLRFAVLYAGVAGLLAGCNNTTSPLMSEPLRPGAEQSAAPSAALPPPARGRQYDPGIAPGNEDKSQTVGAVVTTTGGQKTQQEKAEEERAALEKEQNRQRAEQARQLDADERTGSQ